MLIQNNTTWAKMPLGQKVTWAIVYLGKDTTWAMWSLGQKPTWAMQAGAMVAWAKKALGNRGLGKSGSTEKKQSALSVSVQSWRPDKVEWVANFGI